MSTPWGFGPWGSGGWGGIESNVASGYASSTNSVILVLPSPAKTGNVIGDGDATNPRTWLMENLDTGQVFTILASVRISTQVYELHTLEKLGDYQHAHRLSSSSLQSDDDLPYGGGSTLDFRGVIDASKGVASGNF